MVYCIETVGCLTLQRINLFDKDKITSAVLSDLIKLFQRENLYQKLLFKGHRQQILFMPNLKSLPKSYATLFILFLYLAGFSRYSHFKMSTCRHLGYDLERINWRHWQDSLLCISSEQRCRISETTVGENHKQQVCMQSYSLKSKIAICNLYDFVTCFFRNRIISIFLFL